MSDIGSPEPLVFCMQGIVKKLKLYHFKSFTIAILIWLTDTECLCHSWISSFPHVWLITRFLTWQVPLVEQKLHTLLGSCCSIFSFLWSALWTIVGFFIFFFCHGTKCMSFLDLRHQITLLVSFNFSLYSYYFNLAGTDNGRSTISFLFPVRWLIFSLD